jgi:hypothetical protein
MDADMQQYNTYKKDLFSTLINQIWRVLSGPVILFFIPLFLSPEEQGYWYTFTSLAALAVFADLGFSTIILQFVAHEFAYLHFRDDRTIDGDIHHFLKLASFFRFSILWLSKITFIVFPIIMIGGYLFLSSKQNNFNWQPEWIIYSFASAIVFFNSVMLCFFEGCNSVSLLQSMRFQIAVGQSGTVLIGLYFHFALYSLAASLAVSGIIGSLLLIYRFSTTIKQLWNTSVPPYYDWWPEFSALIWRYAISWCSGYFIFQLFTPMAFKFHGAIYAGKIGISIAMWTAGFGIASSWLTAVTPKINMLIAEHQWISLDKLFNSSLMRCMGTMFIGGSVFLVIDTMLFNRFTFFNRILEPLPQALLFLCWLGQTYVNSVAVYLRAHKKEPLMKMSALAAIYISITTYFCAYYLSPSFLFFGFFSSFFWTIPWVYFILIHQKKEHI